MAKIMLVEDDNNLREIYEARLMAEGYEIVTARDGEEALAVAVKERPDLVISDVMMPKISGFDMLDILRSTPETKNVKVIMMTALSQVEDKERATKLGADRYLVKSQVTLEDVAKVAREVLEGTAANTAAAPAEQAPTEPTAPVATPVVSEPAAAPAEQAESVVPSESQTIQETPAPTEPTAPVATPVVGEPAVAVTAPTMDPITAPMTATPSNATEEIAPAPEAVTHEEIGGITELTSSSQPAETEAASETPADAMAEPEEPEQLDPTASDHDIVKPTSEVWAIDTASAEAPAVTDTSTEPTASPEAVKQLEAAEAHIDASGAQTIEDEETAIAKQIEVMIGEPTPAEPATDTIPEVPLPETAESATDAAPQVPTPEPSEAPSDAPTESTKTAEESAEIPANNPAAPAATDTTPAAVEEPARTTGQKVIQPLNDLSKPTGVDINELAAKTEASETTHVGGSVISPTGEVSSAASPNTTEAPKPGGIDPNSLAL